MSRRSGYSGYSGISGYSGYNGRSGYSGAGLVLAAADSGGDGGWKTTLSWTTLSENSASSSDTSIWYTAAGGSYNNRAKSYNLGDALPTVNNAKRNVSNKYNAAGFLK